VTVAKLGKVVYPLGCKNPRKEEAMKEKNAAREDRNGKRKRWTPPEKLRIVLAGMDPGVEVSDLCRREGVNATMYYHWKRTLLGAAERVFETKSAKPSAREERLTKSLQRAKEVIVEITTENLELKKTFSD
jgi:transposase